MTSRLTPREVLDRAVSEKELQDAVIKLAKLRGWKCYHTFDSRKSAEGFPDLTLVRPPWLLFVELKRETGKLTDAQERWLAALTACGVDAAVWRPSDLSSGRIEEVLT